MRLDSLKARADLDAGIASQSPIPSSIRYFDPYSERILTLENVDKSTRLQVAANGGCEIIDLDDMPKFARDIQRHFVVWCLGRYAPVAIPKLHQGLVDLVHLLGPDTVLYPFAVSRLEVKDYWYLAILPRLISGKSFLSSGAKAYLHFLCSKGLGCLSPEDSHFVRSLRGPQTKLYKSVELGEAFVPLEDQAAIVRYLDEMAADLTNCKSVSRLDLQKATLLACSYEHAMRPIQIAKVMQDDVRLRAEPGDEATAVHVRFHAAKQKDQAKKIPMIRKIHATWAPIFIEYDQHRQVGSLSQLSLGNDQIGAVDLSNATFKASTYFQLTPAEISASVRAVSKKILGHPHSCTAFRHSAAQRLVDAGASQEEVSVFLGHRSRRTGGVYYRASSNTVALINKALGLSPVFSRNVRKLEARSVTEKQLATAPDDRQVSGTIHGMPVPKIGKCDVGIGLCPKHPVFSCYSCIDFHPVRNVETHEQVARDLRGVVQLFIAHASDQGSASPFGQLRELLELIEAIIAHQKGRRKS